MKQKLALLLGLAAGLALVGLLRRKRRRPEDEAADPRVAELRRKLAERHETPPGEPPAAAEPAAGEPDPLDVEVARRRVYEEGRAAVDEMRRASEPPE